VVSGANMTPEQSATDAPTCFVPLHNLCVENIDSNMPVFILLSKEINVVLFRVSEVVRNASNNFKVAHVEFSST
jgi:hypothetical protein